MKIVTSLKGKIEYGWHFEQNVYGSVGLVRSLKAGGGSGNIPKVIRDMGKRYRIRKMTSTECFRLMGVRDAEVSKLRGSGISESQQYKMAGNSIVVDVLMGIFGQMFNPQPKLDEKQITFPWW